MASSQSRNILVPVDASEHAEYAFRWALNNIFRPGDLIHLATVGDVPMTYNSPDPSTTVTYANAKAASRKTSVNLLNEYEELLMESKYAFKVHMLYGIPKVEIVKIAQEQNIDLVVMGSRGLNAVKRAVLGSVSEYCVHHLECPVLIIRDRSRPMSESS